MVDTLGLLLRVRVTAADLGDRDGAAVLLQDARSSFPRLRCGWVDAGYRGAFLDWAREVSGVRLQVVARRDGGRRHTFRAGGRAAPGGAAVCGGATPVGR